MALRLQLGEEGGLPFTFANEYATPIRVFLYDQAGGLKTDEVFLVTVKLLSLPDVSSTSLYFYQTLNWDTLCVCFRLFFF